MNRDFNTSRRWVTPTIHIIVWCLIFYSPIMFSSAMGRKMDAGGYLHFVAIPLSHLIVFYVNYFIFIDVFVFRKKLAQFLLSNLLLIAIISFSLHVWNEFVGIGMGPDHFTPPIYFMMARDALIFTMTAALSVALKVTANWYRTEQQRRETEKEKTAAELQNLKSQLNPHFLFNTLNNIYSLTAINQTEAQHAILSLSQLLRYVLYDNNSPTIPLSKEISFIKSYIELMSLRLSDKVKLSMVLPRPEEDKGIMIAPLLFITLIENAFKHGVGSTEESTINILLEIESEKRIICRIENSYYPKSDDDHSGSGIGLENLKKRLALIYPGSHSLVSKIEGKNYTSLLIINL